MDFPSTYALVNLTVLNTETGAMSDPAALIVDGGRIVAVRVGGASDELPERRIDCGGAVALPGLIDMHVHTCHSAEHGPSVEEKYWESPVAMAVNALKNMDRALKAGITSMRDLGADLTFILQLRHEQRQGRIPGPRLFVSGHMITAIGGHGMEFGMNMGYEVCGVDEVRRAVRQHAARKVDLIKLVTSSENMPTQLSLAELTAGVEEAHFQNLKVSCHANFRRSSIYDALSAGVDSIEHGVVLDEELADMMAARGTVYCPTLAIVRSMLGEKRAFGDDSPQYARARRTIASHARSFGLVRERGLTIVGGTDAGWKGIPFDALHDELAIMIALGLTNQQALRSVTAAAADWLGMGDQLGRLQAGALADIVLVASNPLDDMRVLRHPAAIIANGRPISGALFDQPAD